MNKGKEMNEIEKIGVVFFIICMIFCFVVMPVLGIVYNLKNNENKIETTGIITKIDSEYHSGGKSGYIDYHIYVSYQVDGELYESVLTVPRHDIPGTRGEKINIYYDKENPNDIGMTSLDKANSRLAAYIAVVVALGMIVIIGGLVYDSLKKSNVKN